MKFSNDGYIFREKGEPAFRSCWECNPAHDYLKDVDTLHICFVCSRSWVKGQFLNSFYSFDNEGNVINLEEGNKKLVEFLRKYNFEEVDPNDYR